MISDKHKWIFIHIDKNAGSAVEKFMEPWSEDQITTNDGKSYFAGVENLDAEGQEGLKSSDFNGKQVTVKNAEGQELDGDYKHWKAAEYEMYVPEKYATYRKFAVVRNPWERCLSAFLLNGGWWPYANNPERIAGGTEFRNFLMRREFAEGVSGKLKTSFITDQDSFLRRLDGSVDSSIVLLEHRNLSEHLPAYCKQIGIDVGDRELTTVNKTRDEKVHYSKFYTKETENIVAQACAYDVKGFKYKFEQPELGDFDWEDM